MCTPVGAQVTEKLDGGNCCIHRGLVYARTHAHPATHASFSPIKALASTLHASGALPPHVALYGENMTAVHSIEYRSLPHGFFLFGVWDCEARAWLSWDEVVAWAAALELATVPTLHAGAGRAVGCKGTATH